MGNRNMSNNPFGYFEEINGPLYVDECGHGGYIGSVKLEDEEGIDVHLFACNGGQDMCIRAGEADYITPGRPLDLLAKALNGASWEYQAAAWLLLKKTQVKFEIPPEGEALYNLTGEEQQ